MPRSSCCSRSAITPIAATTLYTCSTGRSNAQVCRDAGARAHEKREDPIPSRSVCIAPGGPADAEPLPAAVLDVNTRGRFTSQAEPNLDFRGIGPIGADVPQVAKPGRRFPDRHFSPFHLAPTHSPLEYPTARPPLEDDFEAWFRRYRVRDRPPARRSPSPEIEGMLDRAVDIKRHSKRLDHDLRLDGRVFSASNLKRVAASPHTWVKYASTAWTPWAWSW